MAGHEPAIAVHLVLWYVVRVCHQYVCKNSVGSVYVGGYGGLSESFHELCQVSFLVVFFVLTYATGICKFIT